jgi:hypothetical protein
MCTNLNLLFSGFAGIIVGVIGTYFGQRKLIARQITAANESNEKLLRRIGEQIDLQIGAAELAAVSSLLHSVNIQLGAAGPHGPFAPGEQAKMQTARGLYHARLHKALADMGRAV